MMLIIKKRNLCLVATLLCTLVLLVRHLLDTVLRSNTRPDLSTPPPCFAGDPPSILVVITSKEEEDRTRNIFRDGPMRHTWFSCAGKKLDIRWRFSLQYTSTLYEGYLPHKLSLESETHGDMIENVSTRYSLTRPRLRVLEGILTNFDWDYLVQISDSTLIDPARILNYLPGVSSPYYGGLVALHGGTLPYTQQHLSVYARTTLMNILSALRFVEREPNNEPVTVGKIAEVLKLQPSQIGRGFNGSVDFRAACSDAVFMTDVKGEVLSQGYDSLLSRGSFC